MQWSRCAGLVALGLLLAACGGAADESDFVDIPGIGPTRIDVPRPTTGGQACENSIPGDESIEERVGALRAIGLFADRAAESDVALAASIENTIKDLWGEVPPEPLYAEFAVAGTDADRVWWRDLEADVGQGGEVYVATIEEWAGISVGAFAPTAIAERWASASGPVEVTFTHAGSDVVLTPEYLDDWIDPRILTPINDLIASSARRFTLVRAFDQTAVLLALTDDERAAFEARGWCFD